jgi:hypothetical protein
MVSSILWYQSAQATFILPFSINASDSEPHNQFALYLDGIGAG